MISASRASVGGRAERGRQIRPAGRPEQKLVRAAQPLLLVAGRGRRCRSDRGSRSFACSEIVLEQFGQPRKPRTGTCLHGTEWDAEELGDLALRQPAPVGERDRLALALGQFLRARCGRATPSSSARPARRGRARRSPRPALRRVSRCARGSGRPSRCARRCRATARPARARAGTSPPSARSRRRSPAPRPRRGRGRRAGAAPARRRRARSGCRGPRRRPGRAGRSAGSTLRRSSGRSYSSERRAVAVITSNYVRGTRAVSGHPCLSMSCFLMRDPREAPAGGRWP